MAIKSKPENGRPTEQFTEQDPLKQNGVKDVTQEKRNCGQACMHVFRNVTVEPTMCLLMLSTILMMLTTQNLTLEKACRVNLNFTTEICDSLKLQTMETQNYYEKETQKLVTKYASARTYVSATLPCIISVLAGSWSDKTGRRKVFLLFPIIGQLLGSINNMFNVYFFYELKLEYLIFSEALLEGLSGGFCLAIFTMFAYMSTITNETDRTYRMGLLNFAMTIGFPIGMSISGIMLRKFGYYGCYGLICVTHTINFIYNAFILRDPQRTAEQKQHDNKGFLYFCKTFFDFGNVLATIRVVFKAGPNHRRLRMCFMMLVVAILFGPIFGELSILYLNTRYRFNWDEIRFSIFQTYNFVTHTVGTLFSILVFSKYLQWHDSVLGIISTVSKIASSFVYCFATNEKIFFAGPLIEILNGTSLLAMRSIVSKLVAPDELGKVNSIFGMTENLMPLIYVPLYTGVYKATMDVLPGAVFLMGAAMTLPAVAIFIWLLVEHRRNLKRHKKEKTQLKDHDLAAEKPLFQMEKEY